MNAFKEADSYHGTSIVIAYAHCIAHGYEMSEALGQQERAVDSGYWPLFRYDPRRVAGGESPLKLDSPAPKIDLARFVENETRFRQVEQANPVGFKTMMDQAQKDVRERYALYEQLARAMNPTNLVPGAALRRRPRPSVRPVLEARRPASPSGGRASSLLRRVRSASAPEPARSAPRAALGAPASAGGTQGSRAISRTRGAPPE